ncbi:hypothetical protein ACTXGU_00245 [Niallia sp. 01092]
MEKLNEEGLEFFKEIETEYGLIHIYINHNSTKEKAKEKLKRYLLTDE